MANSLIVGIIDDDEVYRYTITQTLKRFNFAKEIFVFPDGELALNYLEENIQHNDLIPDVIFLDINMPVMNGWQFLEEYAVLKPRIGKQVFVFLVTSSVDPADWERARTISEISDYIVKPITPGCLEEIMKFLEKNVILK